MDEKIAVIGAGVIGCAVALALAREGHRVTLFDRGEPGTAGASFGNVGHIAAELVQPLPSRQLLFGFWKELFAFGGPLQIPLRRLPRFTPWALRFARAAFRREANTRHLAPLVRPATRAFENLLRELRCLHLMRSHGHAQVWFGPDAARNAAAERAEMTRLGIDVADLLPEALTSIARSAHAATVAGVHFPHSGHVVDPLEIVRAFARAAIDRGARFEREEVREVRTAGDRITVSTSTGNLIFDGAVVCAGVWSAPLFAAFGLRAPLEAAHGYHLELAAQHAHVDAPLVYMDQKVLVTPMTGRLRASSFMEFSGLGSAPDPRKPARLRGMLHKLGYRCDDDAPSWRGARPVLPDYLPGIGRAPGGPRLFYAIGHQHIGLTLAPVTADLVADLVAGRAPRHDITGFDLTRFGAARPAKASA